MKVEHYQNVYDAEKLCEKFYTDITIDIGEGKKKKKVIEQKGSDYHKILREISTKVNSFRFFYIYFIFEIQRTKITSDYRARIRICDEAIDFFSSKSFVSNHFIGTYYQDKLMALIQIKDYESAEEVTYKCQELLDTETNAWFNSQSYSLILFLHLTKYPTALHIYQTIIENKFFKFRFQQRDEIWRIRRAYLYYLFRIGKLELPSGNSLSKFRLQKFLNEVPSFSMKKKLEHIPILTIQILILIVDRDYDRLMSCIEAIEKYTSRYLRKDENFRSNCFIKMILEVPKRNFHRIAVERHAKRYVDRLKTVPLQIADQPFAIEIIPYEHLWEYTLESLDRKFPK